MAEALIKLQNNVNPNLSDEDKAVKLWKRGDVVIVRDDGWSWGSKETFPEFEVVSIPGTAADYQHLETPHTDPVEPASSRRIPRLRAQVRKKSLKKDKARRKWCWNFITLELEAK